MDRLEEFELWVKDQKLLLNVKAVEEAISIFKEGSHAPLRTSDKWTKIENVNVLSCVGWRTDDIYGEEFKPCNFYFTPITNHEFFKRNLLSTCTTNKGLK